MRRSIPIQFWPAFWLQRDVKSIKCVRGQVEWGTYNRPRIQILRYCWMFVEGMTIAGSLPPSSSVTGVRCVVAASATFLPTSSEPMNVICLIHGDFVSASASSG